MRLHRHVAVRPGYAAAKRLSECHHGVCRCAQLVLCLCWDERTPLNLTHLRAVGASLLRHRPLRCESISWGIVESQILLYIIDNVMGVPTVPVCAHRTRHCAQLHMDVTMPPESSLTNHSTETMPCSANLQRAGAAGSQTPNMFGNIADAKFALHT